MDKPAEVFRLFLVGGSPIWGGRMGMSELNLSTHLYHELEWRKLPLRLEIINASYHGMDMMGIGRAMIEVGDYSPDLILVYIGGIFPPVVMPDLFRFDLLKNPRRFRMLLFLSRFRLFAAARRLPDRPPPVPETMEAGSAFRFNEPGRFDRRLLGMTENHKTLVLKQFKSFLKAYEMALRGRELPLLFLEVVANMADAPPLASIHHNPREKDLLLFARHFQKGLAFYEDGDCVSALPELEAAFRIDPEYAGNAYLLGKCRQATGDLAGAGWAYRLARDSDASPERITSLPSALLREWCAKNGIPYLALESEMMRHAPRGVIGWEFFRNITHPTALGFGLFAAVVADWMEREG